MKKIKELDKSKIVSTYIFKIWISIEIRLL